MDYGWDCNVSCQVVDLTVSLAERKWPQFKITPTDDSFRLACTLKVALVITKAMVVFLVAGLEQKTAEFKRWALVTISF